MNEEQFRGQYNILKGKIKERWGRLTDDELTEVNGRREQLLGFIQKKYGLAKERAEEELSRFLNTCDPKSFPKDARNPADARSSQPAGRPDAKPANPKGFSNPNQEREKASRR